MTRQLIICSALIASVTGPALAVTNNPTLANRLSNPAAEHRISTAAAANRGSNPADLFRASNVAGLRHPIPVDFVPHLTHPGGTFGVGRDITIGSAKASEAASLFRVSNAADLFRKSDSAIVSRQVIPFIPVRYSNPVEGRRLGGLDCSSYAVGRRLGEGACFHAPIAQAQPLWVDDRKLHRTCTAQPCIPLIVWRDPSWMHHIGAQDRVDLNARKVILRRMPAPGHVISVQLHIGDTTSVTGGIDNQ
jgi:hypothetical protein